MHGQHIGGSVAHSTATDVRPDVTLPNRHHGHRLRGRQPVRFVVTACIVAHIVEVAEDKWHGAETLQTGTRPTQVLVACTFIALKVEQTVPVPQFCGASGALGNVLVLTVTHQEEA